MDELINKISSYNLFNYLLPGAVFSVFIEKITSYKVIQDDLLVSIFLIYFVGLIINRIGSLLIEPIFKKLVNFSNYKAFVEASKSDAKLEVLSEVNNMYRTFIAMFVSLFCIKLYDFFCANTKYDIYVLFAALFLLFVFSHIKQIGYINQRTQKNKQ